LAGWSLSKVQFCPKCGLALLPTKKQKNVVLSCPKCGYETKKSDRTVQKLDEQKENVIVIGREEEKIRTLPKTKIDCPKCGHKEAFYWLVQTRGADESSTQFFRCTSCGTTWRENS
jgi:DNA-directed RNA polymerase subunit M